MSGGEETHCQIYMADFASCHPPLLPDTLSYGVALRFRKEREALSKRTKEVDVWTRRCAYVDEVVHSDVLGIRRVDVSRREAGAFNGSHVMAE